MIGNLALGSLVVGIIAAFFAMFSDVPGAHGVAGSAFIILAACGIILRKMEKENE